MAADRSNSRRKISRILLIKGTLDIVGLILCKDLREQSHAFQVMATIIYQNHQNVNTKQSHLNVNANKLGSFM